MTTLHRTLTRPLPPARQLGGDPLAILPKEEEGWRGELVPNPAALARGNEEAAVQLALRQGVSDSARLTDLVFQGRHPERGGRPIARGEQALIQEWLRIRDHLVAPLLARRASAAPTAAASPAGAFRPMAVESPGGGRIRDKRDPASGDTVNVGGVNGPIPLRRVAAQAWSAMVSAARAAGIASPLLLPVSGYRSSAHQQRLWDRALARYGTREEARKWVAPPGGSPHQSGRAIDLYLGTRNDSTNVAKLRQTPAYQWLVANAQRFGFYPYEREPWHWEYNPPAAGPVAAGAMSGELETARVRAGRAAGQAGSAGGDGARALVHGAVRAGRPDVGAAVGDRARPLQHRAPGGGAIPAADPHKPADQAEHRGQPDHRLVAVGHGDAHQDGRRKPRRDTGGKATGAAAARAVTGTRPGRRGHSSRQQRLPAAGNAEMSDTWFEGVSLAESPFEEAESPFASETESPFAGEADAYAETWTPAGAGLPAAWPEYEHEVDGGLAESPFAAEDPTSAWARAADTGDGEAGLEEAELEADYGAVEDEERSSASGADLGQAQASLEGQLEEELGFEPSNPPVNLEGLFSDVARGAAGILGGADRVAGWFVDVAGGTPPATAFVKRLIAAGTRNQNALTDAVFYAMHPELSHRKLDPGNAWDKDLIRQWHALRNEIVIPALGRADLTAPPIAPAAPPHVTVDQFLADNRAALARFPTADDAELRLLLTAIIDHKILDVDWGVLKADPSPTPKRVALVPLVFRYRTGKLIDQDLWIVDVHDGHKMKPSPAHHFSPGEWDELTRIRDLLVYPMLRFVLPRIQPGPPDPPSSGVGERVAARAHCYLGVRYQWGPWGYRPLLKDGETGLSCSDLRDRGEGTLDCAALVNYVYRDVLRRKIVLGKKGSGVQRLLDSPDFRNLGKPQDVALQPGDLLLRKRETIWQHVGIFMKGGDVIEAPYTKTVVRSQCYDNIPKKWQLVLRFNEERGGAAEVADVHLRYEDSPSASAAPSGPFGTLVVDTSGWEYTYPFTAEDVLWTAKLTLLEAGKEDDAPSQAVIWAMFNNWALFAHKTGLWRSFTAFVRAYSTTLQPVLVNVNAARAHYGKPGYVAIKGAGFYKGTDIRRGQLERHLRTQQEPWRKLPAATRSLAERALRGEVPNPGIGNATKFGSSLIWWQRANKTRRKPTEEEWRRYTQSITCSRTLPCSWVGDVPDLDQKPNAFFLDRRASHLPPDAVRVVPP